MYVPTKIFFTRGAGIHREELASFEMALRACRVAQYNLVQVSSIFPPGCKIIKREEGIGQLEPGQIVHVVMAKAATNEPRRLVAASVGVAIPKDPKQFGYLSEYHGFGKTDSRAGEYAEDLAAEMLATVLGVDFDPDKSWDEKREVWRISGKIVNTRNVTQSAQGQKDGLWTTTLAMAILLP